MYACVHFPPVMLAFRLLVETYYGWGGGAVPTRGVLKMGHFTRKRRTARQSNIPIPLPCEAKGAYSDLNFRTLISNILNLNAKQ